MEKYLYVVLIHCLIIQSLFAQTGEGLSKPGSITNPFKVQSVANDQEGDLSCTISYTDLSGDQVLNENETGTVSILISNNSSKTVNPKLDITIHASWLSKPKTSVKWMDSLAPGKSNSYQSTLTWDERMPSGSITYVVKASDTQSEIVSEPSEIVIEIVGTGGSLVSSEPQFVDVDKFIPRTGVFDKYSVAVIIGNQDYVNKDVPDVEFAGNDAGIVKKYLMNMLGYKEENIIFINNADKADFERVFGTERVHQGKLFNWVKPNVSDVFIYYSGHGAPDIQNKKMYFMPANSDPNYIKIDGYPLDTFYANLNKLPAKSITIVLDACFSGGSHPGMLIKNASPMYIQVESPVISSKINLFASAQGDQIASWYPEGKHSLFTYFYLRALRGEADNNSDRKVTVKEIRNYLNDNVPYIARRLYGREQTPVVQGVSSHVICSY